VPSRLTNDADYHRFIDPLLTVTDFGISYSEDGAADASVLFPSESDPYERPRDSVLALVHAGRAAFPALIDCLIDPRVTSVRFNGNRNTRQMNVPVGYVCLDLLMAFTVPTQPVWEKDCEEDGLGGCVKDVFISDQTTT
jgi:hypothetical protein